MIYCFPIYLNKPPNKTLVTSWWGLHQYCSTSKI